MTTHAIEREHIARIQWMLMDAIKAKVELDLLWENVEQAAQANYTADMLLSYKPEPVDLLISEAAEMAKILSVLPAGKEVR